MALAPGLCEERHTPKWPSDTVVKHELVKCNSFRRRRDSDDNVCIISLGLCSFANLSIKRRVPHQLNDLVKWVAQSCLGASVPADL